MFTYFIERLELCHSMLRYPKEHGFLIREKTGSRSSMCICSSYGRWWQTFWRPGSFTDSEEETNLELHRPPWATIKESALIQKVKKFHLDHEQKSKLYLNPENPCYPHVIHMNSPSTNIWDILLDFLTLHRTIWTSSTSCFRILSAQ